MAAYLDSHHFQETRNRSAAVYKHSQFARQTKQNFVGLGFWKFGFPENSAYFGHNGGRYNKPSRFPKTNNFGADKKFQNSIFLAHTKAHLQSPPNQSTTRTTWTRSTRPTTGPKRPPAVKSLKRSSWPTEKT